MKNARKIISILTMLAIFYSLFIMVFAVGDPIAEIELVQPVVNAYEYAKAPTGIYVFRYYGENPYADLEIDISECVVDRLYTYFSENNTVVEISTQAVSDYTCTQTALYYVTEDQMVYRTDYAGVSHEYLYQCTQGTISMLRSYYDALYFIENQARIMYLDVASKVAQEIWEYEYLDWVFMLNDTQLIATSTDEKDYLYDIQSDTATRVSNIVATNIVTATIKGTTINARSSGTTANYANAVFTQENNVSFPLMEYWADPDGCYEATEPYRSAPSSWFHKNPEHEGCYDADGNQYCQEYGGSGECEGFARYVHDEYAHMKNYNIDEREEWADDKCIIEHDYLEYETENKSNDYKLWPEGRQNIGTIQAFFEGLNTGAYVRYGKYRSETEPDPEDGCHSIVFIASDANGIWVYECNQDYTYLDDGQTLNGKPQSYYGCGVFLQYYPYERLFRYKYILHYVNHNYTESKACYDDEYHKKVCLNCDAYVLQEHTADPVLFYVNGTQHRASFACCSGSAANVPHTDVQADYVNANRHRVEFVCCDAGNIRTLAHNDVHNVFVNHTSHRTEYRCCDYTSASTAHTGSVSYREISTSKHRVMYSCCSGYITETHTFDYNENGQDECIYCGYVDSILHNFDNQEVS